jgi:GT2 family glycosyltransferase
VTGPPDVSVVVPAHNRVQSLEALLVALAGQTMPKDRFEVIVVDDCSVDGTADLLRSVEAGGTVPLRWFTTPSNSGGPSRPRNLGWQAARAPIVAFIDDDCIPAPEWLEHGVTAMQVDGEIGVLQARTELPPGKSPRNVGRWVVWREVKDATGWFECANIFYARAALEEVGGFDESLRTWGEDSDLGWRVVEAGWQRGYTDRAVVVHALEDRGWKEAARFGWRDAQLVELAARHPGMRQQAFWRPWAMSEQGARFAVGLAGALLALRWRPAVLLAVPYALNHRPSIWDSGRLRLGAETLAVDSVRLAGRLRGSFKARIFVV